MQELGGPLGRAQLKKNVTNETPTKRLARVKAEAKLEAYVARKRMPLERGSFSGFLRTGSY